MARGRSIRRKLGLGMALALGLGVFVLALFYVASLWVVRATLEEDTAQTAMLVANMLDREVEGARTWVEDLARSEPLELGLAPSADPEPARKFLDDRLRSGMFTGCWLLDDQDQVVAGSLSGSMSIPPPAVPQDRDTAFPVIQGRLYLALACPVAGVGRARGRLITLSRFPDQAVFEGVGSRGFLGLALWVGGRLVSASSWLLETDYASIRASFSGRSLELATDQGERPYLAVPLPITAMAKIGGVRAEIVRDMHKAQLPFSWLVFLFLGAWLVMAAIFLVFGRYISSRLVDPILALSREAERIRKTKSGTVQVGHIEPEEEISEIDRLYRSFNLMVQALDQALERASKAEEKYRGIFFNALEGIFQISTTGRFISINPAMAGIFGYESAELMLKTVRDLDRRHYVDQADRLRLINTVQSKGMVEGFELRLRRVDGKILWISTSVRAVRDPDGQVVMYEGSMVDVTESKRSAQALKEAKERAEAALSELEAFSYSVSHDLRTPLRAADGFSQALLEDYGHKLDQEGRDYVQRVRKAVQRIGELIDDLQNLVRVMRLDLRREKVDLSALAQRVLAEMAAANPQREMNLSVEPRMAVLADPNLLELVYRHLLGNAWKFTANTENAAIEVGVSEVGGEKIFHVKDNGAGFDMAFAHKLFGPFGRLHSPQEYEGSGIGLAIVKRAVTRHNGRIWADAAPNEGARFFFTLG